MPSSISQPAEWPTICSSMKREVACDDRAISVTHRPLTLASVLAKVWLHAVSEPEPSFTKLGIAQPLVEPGEGLHGRIERLRSSHDSVMCTSRSRALTFTVNTSALITLVVTQVANLTIILVLIGCNPFSLFTKFL